MTIERDTARHEIVLWKLKKLSELCRSLSTEDFPYPDSTSALEALRLQAEKLLSQAESFPALSPRIQHQFLLQANYRLESFSQILGIIARSNSMRNNFEIYMPFRRLCESFFNGTMHLILSSEWNYTPFTYPMNLQELPTFIIIGLPAPESTNVLIFPSAGHELGHSIWLERSFSEKYSGDVYQRVTRYLRQHDRLLSPITPLSNDKDQNDLFAKQLVDQFSTEATNSCLRQLEEVFCDFVGLQLFGESYLHAFQYLVAPGNSARSLDYPQTRERANILQLYSNRLGFNADNYIDEFIESSVSSSHLYETLLLRVADAVRDQLVDEMFSASIRCLHEAGAKSPSEEEIATSYDSFRQGMPTDKIESVGSLICAAWRLFLNQNNRALQKGDHSPISYVSDLVLKSVESHEFYREMKNVKRGAN